MTLFFEKNEAFSKRYNKQLLRICDPLFRHFSIRKFFYQYVSKEGGFNFFGTNVELIDYFFENKFHLSTPFMTQYDPLQTGLYLMDAVKNSDFQSALGSLEAKFQAKHSFTLSRCDGNFCHQYGFFVPSGRSDLEALLLNEIPMLKSFITYFESEMASVICKLREDPIDMRKAVGKRFGEKSHGIPDIHLQSAQKEHFLSQLASAKTLLAHYQLSAKELECIRHFMTGKTSPEIAKSLHRSTRTIEHRLESIKAKLGCSTKSELFGRLQKMADLPILLNLGK